MTVVSEQEGEVMREGYRHNVEAQILGLAVDLRSVWFIVLPFYYVATKRD